MSETILGLENTKESIKTVENPTDRVDNFIEEFHLNTLLTKEFHSLKEEQKVKVITDLKRRIVDIVKTGAETQYSEIILREPKIGKILVSLNREKFTGDIEKRIFAELRDEKWGADLISKDINLLVQRARGQEVGYNVSTDEPCVFYLNHKDPKLTKETADSFYVFNLHANDFAKVPYEWGQERSGKHKKTYDEAKAKYENAREEVLKTKTAEKGPEAKGQAMIEILEIDNSIRMEQLLNTHPEFEQALDNFQSNKEGGRIKKMGERFLKSITLERTALAGAGAGLRTIAKGAALATGMTGITLAATPIIGGAIGYFKGKFKAKGELLEKQKEARHGGWEEREKGITTTACGHLTKRLEDIMEDIEKADGKNKEEYTKKLAMLGVRIEHTIGKIEKGQVDFGTSDDALVNQYNLTNTLNRAITLKELSTLQDDKKKKEIDTLLETIARSIGEKNSKAQKEFIKKQARKGMLYGAGFALAGYGVKYLFEYFNITGQETTENISQKSENLRNLRPRPNGTPIPEKTPTPIPTSTPTPNIENTPTPTTITTETPIPETKENISEILETRRDPFVPIKNFANEGIIFENGKGGIQGILDLKKQILTQYNGDYSKAPQGIQDFMDTDATRQAIKLGFFDPNNVNESALIKEGSVLKFDENGNLLFGKPDVSGSIPKLEKYTGNMLNINAGPETAVDPSPVEASALPEDLLTEKVSSSQIEEGPLPSPVEPLPQTPSPEEMLKEKIEEQMKTNTEEASPEPEPVKPIPDPKQVTTIPKRPWFRKFFR